jgi:hypothetical protein
VAQRQAATYTDSTLGPDGPTEEAKLSSAFWTRASVSLVAGALAAVLASPLASLAASPGTLASVLPPGPETAQFAGASQCVALGGGGLTSAGLQQGGLSRIFSFGAGGFYSPYYNPAYSSFGLGTVGTFLNFTGGQQSPLAVLSGTPYCAGLGITPPAPTGGPFLVRDFGLLTSPLFGFQGAGGFGQFGVSPFGGAGGVGGLGGFGSFGFGFR